MPRESKQPLGPTLRGLLEQRGWSYRDLARKTGETDPSGRGLGSSYVNQLANGHAISKPETLRETIELLAATFQIPPTYFREYRELLAAEAAIRVSRDVGLERFLAELEEIRRR